MNINEYYSFTINFDFEQALTGSIKTRWCMQPPKTLIKNTLAYYEK